MTTRRSRVDAEADAGPDLGSPERAPRAQRPAAADVGTSAPRASTTAASVAIAGAGGEPPTKAPLGARGACVHGGGAHLAQASAVAVAAAIAPTSHSDERRARQQLQQRQHGGAADVAELRGRAGRSRPRSSGRAGPPRMRTTPNDVNVNRKTIVAAADDRRAQQRQRHLRAATCHRLTHRACAPRRIEVGRQLRPQSRRRRRTTTAMLKNTCAHDHRPDRAVPGSRAAARGTRRPPRRSGSTNGTVTSASDGGRVRRTRTGPARTPGTQTRRAIVSTVLTAPPATA